ncbi:MULTISPECIES: hypothetical protein [Paenibacillus]|uniref:Glycosyltransferase n=1 Tax=Paenibacillus campinasensis TaxID=66347 RepID=A0ABW9T458_9BACL|nr:MULTISPECIES: hypothetical protein [Paenibacillus]MUG68079.1 hypothetical protein [Paenibacillus campinasensis]PAK51966.1 hypothetical protein CHH75_13100 [Paenibacillus sp. 7541]
MVAHLLWILAVYGAAVALVHIIHRRSRDGYDQGRTRTKHYVLITSNHEHRVEWYLRALSLYALLSGSRVKVTVLDKQSDDDTMKIVSRLKGLTGIELEYHSLGAEDPNLVATDRNPLHDLLFYVDLRLPREAARIPYVQG